MTQSAVLTVPVAEPTSAELTRLLEQVREQRDRNAFMTLFEYYAPRLKSYLMRQGSKDDEAEEFVQEALLTVWRKTDAFDASKASAGTWIFTIARNKRIDALRRKKGVHTDLENAMDVQSEENIDAVVETLSSERYYEQMQNALRELPDEQKDLLMKSFFDNKSHAQIAEETGLPLGTVKSRIRLAMERLRRHMPKERDAA